MSTFYGVLAVVAVLGVVFACVLKAENGETYEDRQRKLADRQRKLADKLFKDKRKDKGE